MLCPFFYSIKNIFLPVKGFASRLRRPLTVENIFSDSAHEKITSQIFCFFREKNFSLKFFSKKQQLTFFGVLNGGDFLRADYVYIDTFNHLLAALTPENKLILETSLATGLRIGDVLSLKTAALKPRMTIKEQKTGKSRRVSFPKALYERLIAHSGRFFVFPNRLDPKRPKTRQAVYKDLKRASKAFRIKNLQLSPHSARKIYAVTQYRRSGDIKRVQRLLNHSSEAVSMLYAMADEITARNMKSRVGKADLRSP